MQGCQNDFGPILLDQTPMQIENARRRVVGGIFAKLDRTSILVDQCAHQSVALWYAQVWLIRLIDIEDKSAVGGEQLSDRTEGPGDIGIVQQHLQRVKATDHKIIFVADRRIAEV